MKFVRLLLLCFCVSRVSWAPPRAAICSVMEEVGSIRSPIELGLPLERAFTLQKVLRELSKRIPNFSAEKLQLLREEPDGIYERKGWPEEAFVLRYGKIRVAEFFTAVNGHSLRFDINIEKRFEDCGIYSFLLAKALERNPETSQIPARISYIDSDNAKKFISACCEGTVNFHKLSDTGHIQSMTVPEILSLRETMVRAYYEMPAANARIRLGFGRVTKIVLDPRSAVVGFVTGRGPIGPSSDVEIVMRQQKGVCVSLNRDGKVTEIPAPLALSLGDFPE